MSKWIRAILLTVFFASCWRASFAQGPQALINDVRREIGEPDSTTEGIKNAEIRMWLNMYLREASLKGMYQKYDTLRPVVGQDTLRLPADFLWPFWIQKTVHGTRNRVFVEKLDSTPPNLIERTDTIAVNPGTEFSILPRDVIGIRSIFKRDSLKKRIVPVMIMRSDTEYIPTFLPETKRLRIAVNAGQDTVKLPSDFGRMVSIAKRLSGGKRGAVSPIAPESASLAYLRQMPQSFLFERLDTVIRSATKPEVSLSSDVYTITSGYRKDGTTKEIFPLIQVPRDSLSKIGTDKRLYYYFVGQPFPRVNFAQAGSVTDTAYFEVLAILPRYFVNESYDSMHILNLFPAPAAADTLFISYNPIQTKAAFLGQPFPRLAHFPQIGVQDTLYVQSVAEAPRYLIFDSTSSDPGLGIRKKYLLLSIPAIKADTLMVCYAALMDTMKSNVVNLNDTINIPLLFTDKSSRSAAIFYVAERWYDKLHMREEAVKYETKWKAILEEYIRKKRP